MTPVTAGELKPQVGAPPAKRQAAATAFPDATVAAVEILQAGGNAVDAAVAAAWALSVCEPGGSGLGGQTTILLYTADGLTRVIDGHSHAPAGASLDTISESRQRIGHRACTIPSTPATLGYAQAKYGVLPREQVMAPAIQIAEEGYRVTPLQRRQLGWVTRHLRASAAASNLFLVNGVPPRAGDKFRQPELAATLYRLAEQGTNDFYQGTIADLIALDMKANGGLITERDLADFGLPVEREPISIDYRGFRVISIPPPGGGLHLLLALMVLQHLGDDFGARPAAWYESVAATTYAVFREREESPISPDELIPSCRNWLSDERARKIADEIRVPDSANLVHGSGDGPGDTTHLTVADRHGNVVALTQSIQSIFGAKVAHPALGFVYNNYLCTCPRGPHPYQLNSRCMPRSNAAPTMVLRNTSTGFVPLLALGAAGSRRITSSLLQVVSHVVDRKLEVADAVAAPRVHALLSGKVWIEQPAASQQLLANLQRRFSNTRIRLSHDYAMGCVQALQWAADGTVSGAADPRRDGAVAILE